MTVPVYPRRPWSPIPLVLVALVGGLPGAGALLAINWYRLGRPDLGRKTAVILALLTLLGAALLGWLNSKGHVGGMTPESAGQGIGIEMAWYLAQIGIALFVAVQQRGLFEQFLAKSSPPEGLGRALVESIAAMGAAAVGGIIVHRAIVRLAVRIFTEG